MRVFQLFWTQMCKTAMHVRFSTFFNANTSKTMQGFLFLGANVSWNYQLFWTQTYLQLWLQVFSTFLDTNISTTVAARFFNFFGRKCVNYNGCKIFNFFGRKNVSINHTRGFQLFWMQTCLKKIPTSGTLSNFFI